MKTRCALLAAALLIGLAACRGPSSKLVVYSAGPRPLAAAICERFTAATGIPVELFSATTGQIMAKLEAERFNPRADVVILANQTAALGLKEAGRLMSYVPPGISPRKEWNDPEGAYHATGAAAVGLAFLAAREPAAAAGWRAALLETPRLVMPSPSRSGTAGDFLLAYRQLYPETFWEDFLEARVRGLQIVGANSQAITGLLIGAYDAVFAAADYIICREIQKGEPLAVTYPGNASPYILRPAAILKSTKNADAAKRFVDWLFTTESQRMIAAEHLLPAAPDVPLSAIRSRFPVPDPLPFNPRAALHDQKTLVRKFQYEVERAALKPAAAR